LSGGTIPAGSPANPGTCSISIEITAPADTASGTFRNVIPPDGLTTDQGIGNLRPGTATVVITGTEVAAIKSFSPSTIQAGGNSRLRIDITAPSDTDLTDFSITDNLPAGLSVSNSTPPTAIGCGPTPPMILSAPTGATSISLTNGLIRAGERCRIEIYVTGTTAGLHTNIIQPTDITNNEGRRPTGDVTSSLTIVNGGNQSIALVKGFNPLTVFGGSASTMSIELINTGSLTLSGIAFTDNMPNGMILATPPNFNVGTCGGTLQGSPGDSSFTYSGGNLPPSGRCILTLNATLTVNGNLTNVIPSGAVTTTNGVINADPAEATLTNLPGVSISKFFVSNPIRVNSSSALTITVQNTGNIALSGLGFSDSLPSGITIAGGSAPAPVNNCGGTLIAASGTQLIQLTDGMLDGNSSCTIVVYITARVAGNYQNTIPPGDLTNDQDVTNTVPGTDTLVVRDNPEEDDDDDDRGQNPPRGNAGNFLIPVTGFAPGRVTRLSDSLRPNYEETSLMIEIPILRVKSPIVGVESKQRRWDVAWLQDQVGWLQGTAYPTWDGNSVLTGHAVNADGKPGVFSRLKALGIGEYIFLYSSGYRYTYEVITNASVVPTDISVMKHEEKSVLTLITCDEYDEKTGINLRRVAVRAVLVDVSLTR
jgi:LPXTG-site transpeptidase (sortase) family protein